MNEHYETFIRHKDSHQSLHVKTVANGKGGGISRAEC